MDVSEVQPILRMLLSQIDALLVNQDVLTAAMKDGQTRANLQDVLSAANKRVSGELKTVRELIEGLK